jgi:hypothetical protein
MNYELVQKEKQYAYREQDPTYMGEPLDRELAEGPREHRKFRDCLCLIIYALFWAALIIVASYAFTHGNPQLLAAPFDSTGNALYIKANNVEQVMQSLTPSRIIILKI